MGNNSVAPEGAVTHSENTVAIDQGHFSKEFINSEEGIRENFIIEQAPEGVKSLEAKLAVSGATVRYPGMYVLVTKHADGSELSHKVAVRK